jgi:hypothetical protein
MQQRYFLFLNLLLLISCSQEPSERLSLELIVDGKQVIKKSSADKDANQLYLVVPAKFISSQHPALI